MVKSMKAAVVRGLGQPLAIEDVPVSTPGPGEVLVKIVSTGVCHTDLHAADEDWPMKHGLVRPHIHKAKLSDINRVFAGLKSGAINGGIVIRGMP